MLWWDDNIHSIVVGWSVSQLRTGNRALPGADDPDHQEYRLRYQVDGAREPKTSRPNEFRPRLLCLLR